MFWRKTLIYKETIIVALIIAYLSLIKEPIIRLPENVAFADKWEHLLAYIVLGAVLVVDLWRAKVEIKCLWIVPISPQSKNKNNKYILSEEQKTNFKNILIETFNKENIYLF